MTQTDDEILAMARAASVAEPSYDTLLEFAQCGIAEEVLRLRAEVAEAKSLSILAFVRGADWARFTITGFTSFPSERDMAEDEARKRYPYTPPVFIAENEALREMDSRLRAEVDAAEGKADELDTVLNAANDRLDSSLVPAGKLADRVGMVLNEAADMRIANEKLEAEVAKMRALVKELGHEGGATYVCGTFFNPPRPCDCERARKELLEMLDEVTT